jgi:UDP-sugar pyrophosphorylase
LWRFGSPWHTHDVNRHKSDPSKSLVINVEYNQLDPLLRSQGDCKGDIPDPATGYSPFPGNANNLILEMGAYAKTLRGDDQGVVLEFVNPKYKDATRTEFNKPTRLECMMQDIPKLFQKELGSNVNIGFTMFDRWFTFSPAKVCRQGTNAVIVLLASPNPRSRCRFVCLQNSLEAGVEAVKQGSNAPGTMSSAESDKYIQNQRKLKFAGVNLPVTQSVDDLVLVGGIPVTRGPRIMICPSFAITQEEIMDKVHGKNIRITERSSLVLDGHHLKIKNLDLDGALVIRAGDETHVTVDGLKVHNLGWELVENKSGKNYPETVSIRGYTMAKYATKEYLLHEPGTFVIGEDGEVKKLE